MNRVQPDLRILILEDNPSDAELIQFELKQAGFTFSAAVVETEETYKKALREFTPDLILSDYDLPLYNGVEALSHAKQSYPEIPFILVTGAVTEDRAIEVLTSGARDYVLKHRLNRLAPAMERVLAEVEEHKARRKAEEELRSTHRNLERLVQERTAALQAEIEYRRRSEEALKESEQRWLTTLSGIGDAVIATDQEGRITFMNAVAEKATGWPSGEAVSRPLAAVFNIINEHTRLRAEDPVSKVLREGTIVALANHTILIRKDGGEIPIEDSGAPIRGVDGRITGVVLVFRDITESKKAQGEIAYRASFPRLNPNPITELDLEGNLRYVNPAAEALFPELQQDGTGHPWLAPWKDVIADLRANGSQQHEREIQIGEEWYSQSLQLVRETGSIRIYGRRITSRRRAESVLKESERRARARLESILSPEGDISTLELEDIIDVPAIQSFMDDFYRLARIPMTIGDLKGKVLVGVGWQDICTKFHRAHPETCKHCLESDTVLTGRIPPGEFRLYKCRNHMWDASTPLMIGGRQVGNLFSGQFFFDNEPLDYDLFRAQARRYGFDEESYLAALDAVPRLSRETLDRAMGLFMKLAEMISKLSYSNIELARALARQDALTAAANESRKQLNRIFDNSMDAIVVSKPEDGRILSVNRAASQMFGWTKEEMQGMTRRDILDLDDPGVKEFLTVRFEKGNARSVLKCRHKDGSTFIGELTSSLFRNRSGEMDAVEIIRDITERKRAEEELKRRSLELEYANRELESFSYSVSHDLRAPLRAIEGFSRILLNENREEAGRKTGRILGMIHENARKMDRLMDDLLALSRSGRKEIKRYEVDMNRLAQEVWKEQSAANPDRNMELILRDLPRASGDRNLIRQVVTNLLANAVKFTGKRKPAVIELGGRTQNGESIYFVRDNGAGFDMQYAHKLFHAFQRLHPESEYEGTGIGLAIVQRIIHRHGGRVWAEGKAGEGATFFFSLPAD